MNIVTQPAKHSAPGPYLGFSLQPVRLCYHLLTCPKGAQVSLEYLDDIAVHGADGSVMLEQTKSALKQNPVSDWADSLWKAVANWLDSIANGEVAAEKAQFRLYVTPTRTGARAQAMSDATTWAEVAAIASEIQAEMGKLKKPPGCLPFLARFLDATEDDRFAVVGRMRIISTDDDPIDPLRALLAPTVTPPIIDLLCQAAIGMAKEQADRLIRNGKPAILDADGFKAGFRIFVQTNNLPGYLASLTGPPKEGEVAAMLSTRPMFIRQLALIEATEEDRVRAVSDFLRTSADKSVWADAGLIFEQSLRDWDDDLVRRHGLICGEIADVHADKDARVRGRIAYRRCSQLQAPLEGRAVPGHFVHGCFNALADVRRLGWHPDYVSLLDEDEA